MKEIRGKEVENDTEYLDSLGGKPCNSMGPTTDCINPQTWCIEIYGDIIFNDELPDIIDECIEWIKLCDVCLKNFVDEKGIHIYDINYWNGSAKDCCGNEYEHNEWVKRIELVRMFTAEERLQEESQ